MELHPSGFVETGGCSGPNYVRSQPNRESPGILLNQVTDKYVAEFNLPFRNVIRYVKEVHNDWNKLTDEQKEVVSNSIKDMSMSPNIDSNGVQTPGPSVGQQIKLFNTGNVAPVSRSISDMLLSLSKNPSDVGALVEEIYSPSEEIKQMIPSESLKSMNSELKKWLKDKKYYSYDWVVLLILCLVLLLCFLMGIAIGYNY